MTFATRPITELIPIERPLRARCREVIEAAKEVRGQDKAVALQCDSLTMVYRHRNVIHGIDDTIRLGTRVDKENLILWVWVK